MNPAPSGEASANPPQGGGDGDTPQGQGTAHQTAVLPTTPEPPQGGEGGEGGEEGGEAGAATPPPAKPPEGEPKPPEGLSAAEFQHMKESTAFTENLKKFMLEQAGVTENPEAPFDAEKFAGLITSEMNGLKAQLTASEQRRVFETSMPIVATPEYQEIWNDACNAKLDPNHELHKKYSNLDYNEMWRLVQKPEHIKAAKETAKELQHQEHGVGNTIPMMNTGSGTPPPAGSKIDAAEFSTLKQMFPNATDEEIMNAA